MYKIKKKLKKYAEKAAKNGDIPVSALIIKNGNLVAWAYNDRQKKHKVTGHAEINAINKAEKKIGDWRLDGFDLYVTLFPCEMCQYVINNARIKNVYYYLESSNVTYQHPKLNFYKINNNYNECFEKLMNAFFTNLRSK